MIHGVLADLPVFVRLSLVKFVAVVKVLRRRWISWAHLTSATRGATPALTGPCDPFVGVEARLRPRAVGHGYTLPILSFFIDRWVFREWRQLWTTPA